MRKAAIYAAFLLVAPLAGCLPAPGGGGGGEGGGGPLEAKVLDFQADGFARQHGGAISHQPIDPEAVFGRTGETPDPVGEGFSYVAISTFSGCDLAKSATLSRRGDDLRVEFELEDIDWIACIRSFEPYVQFAVDSKLVEGVKTIQGEAPLPIPRPDPIPPEPLAQIELSLTPVRFATDGGGTATGTVKLTCTPDGGTHPDPKAACSSLRAVGGDFERLPSTGQPCTREYNPHVARATGSWQVSPDGPTFLVEYEETFSNRCIAAVETDNVFNF